MALTTDTTMQVVPAGYAGNNCGGGMWGGDWSSWIILFLIFGMFGFGGWGGGFGNFGGGGGQQFYDTRADIQRGFDNSAVIAKLDGITQGICDATYALSNTVTNGFHGVDNAICSLGNTVMQGNNATQMAIMQGNNALSAQLAQCCCDNREAIAGVNYNLAQQSCDTRNTINNAARDIIDSNNSGTRAILDALTAQRIEAKDETIARQNQQIFQLQLAASQQSQNGFIDAVGNSIVAQLRQPTPIPSYQVPNPNAYYGCAPCNPCGC